jgi:hypothetical protein
MLSAYVLSMFLILLSSNTSLGKKNIWERANTKTKKTSGGKEHKSSSANTPYNKPLYASAEAALALLGYPYVLSSGTLPDSLRRPPAQ